MKETTHSELMEAMQIFKEKYGLYEPLDNERLEEIIEELKQTKSKKGKKKK